MSYPLPLDPFARYKSGPVIPYGSETPDNNASFTLRSAFRTGATAALGYGAFHLYNRHYPADLPYLNMGLPGMEQGWGSLINRHVLGKDVALDAIKRFEEETPFYLGRTFSLSETLSPWILGDRANLHIPTEVVDRQRGYYEALIGRNLEQAEFSQGFRLAGGKLYDSQNKVLLEHARASLAHWAPERLAGYEDVTPPPLYGRLTQARQDILSRRFKSASSTLIQKSDPFPFHITGGQSALATGALEAQSILELYNRRFFQLLDDPLELMAEIGHRTENVPFLDTVSTVMNKLRLRNRFGLGSNYSGNVAQQWGRWLLPEMMNAQGRNFLRPGALLTFIGAPFAYRWLDNSLRDNRLTEGTILEQGLSGAGANIWQNLMTARAKFGQVTGLSALARKQEGISPGSTEVSTMLGLPFGLGITGAMSGFLYSRLAPTLQKANLTSRWHEIKMASHEFSGPLSRIFSGKYTRSGMWGRIGLLAGAALELPMLPGALARLMGGTKTPEELQDIYSGKTTIPVKAGRFWEGGSPSYLGGKVNYFKSHWTVLAKSDYLNKSLFQKNESALFKAIKRTPILTDIISPYYLEKEHYHDRPYPTTGPSYPGLGPFGSIYAATIGRLFKPVQIMHQDEWQTPEGLKYSPESNAPDPSLGGLPPGEPESPYSLKRTASETWHRWTEAIGLPGWLMRLSTGSEDWATKELQYASAERMTSEERGYWDRDLGGLAASNEWYRRVNVRQRTAIRQNQYNPLTNNMPHWLPGKDSLVDFKSGDAFTKVPFGEARLPGPGYIALHPELEGVDPEDYPLMHRLRILSDVSPYSTEYHEHLAMANAARKAGQLQPDEEQQIVDIKRKVATVKKRKEFAEFRDWTEENMFARGVGKYWETLSHSVVAEQPWENIVPFRPGAKFIHKRDPIEEYEKTMVFGTDAGFWNKPWSSFIRPSWESTAHELLGADDVPAHVQQVRDTEEWFDKLKYLRARRHEHAARRQGDLDAAQAWRTEASKTMVGASPQYNPYTALAALPKAERDYLTAFSKEQDPQRQEKILSLVPEGVARLYRLIWERQAHERLENEAAAGKIDTKTKEYQEIIAALKADMQTGSRATPEMLERYQEEQPGVNLNEWLREQELTEFFQDHPLPPEQALLWDPRVDLEDVKLQVIKQDGKDIHDFNLWESRERLLARKPYVAQAAAALKDIRSPEDVRRQIRSICEGFRLEDIQVDVIPSDQPMSQVNLSHDRQEELRNYAWQNNHARKLPRNRKATRERNHP